MAPVRGRAGQENRGHGWLELIAERLRRVFAVSLSITNLGGGHATLENEADRRWHHRTPWMVVGRFDPHDELDYATLAHGLLHVADDIVLEAAIHPQRMSQIRVEFHDLNDVRREGDTVLTKIGPWEYVTSDLAGELVGASWQEPTEGSLAARYDSTTVPRFYIFFANEVIRHKPAAPWMKVATHKKG